MSEDIEDTDPEDRFEALVSRRKVKALKKEDAITDHEEIVLLAVIDYEEQYGIPPTSEALKAFLREQGYKLKGDK